MSIKNKSLLENGSDEIDMAFIELPGLLSIHKELGSKNPFKNCKISCFIELNSQNAALIETLSNLGAEIRIFITITNKNQKKISKAIEIRNKSVKIISNSNLKYWEEINETLNFNDKKGPDIILDNKGDVINLIHKGYGFEQLIKNNKEIKDFDKDLKTILNEINKKEPKRWQNIITNCKGVVAESIFSVESLKMLFESEKLLIPAFDVSNSIIRKEFDECYGLKESLLHEISGETGFFVSGKKCVIFGFDMVGKVLADFLKSMGSVVSIIEKNPINALKACLEGYLVRKLENLVKKTDLLIISNTYFKEYYSLTLHHLKSLKNNSVIINLSDYSLNLSSLSLKNEITIKSIKKDRIDKITLSNEKSIFLITKGKKVNMAWFSATRIFALSELWRGNHNENKIKKLPLIFDEKVAASHLPTFEAELTTFDGKLNEKRGNNKIDIFLTKNEKDFFIK